MGDGSRPKTDHTNLGEDPHKGTDPGALGEVWDLMSAFLDYLYIFFLIKESKVYVWETLIYICTCHCWTHRPASLRFSMSREKSGGTSNMSWCHSCFEHRLFYAVVCAKYLYSCCITEPGFNSNEVLYFVTRT